MKKQIILLLLFAIGVPLGLRAQDNKVESSPLQYRQGGWWTFGINAGLSYQSSDVRKEFNGWGLGATLGKNLYYRPNGPLAFDLRGRFLYANQKGQDYERSYGLQFNEALNGGNRGIEFGSSLNYHQNSLLNQDSFYYANHRTDLLELGLEGVINLNRLRERTGVIVNLYGGLNVDWYQTRINQADGGETEYDYSDIPPSGDRTTTLNTLQSLMDNSYETVADGFDSDLGTFTWMPSLGFELGYQPSPRWYFYGGHKFTWSRDDIMDGQRWNDDNTATGNNDLYHYTHLGVRWIIEPSERMAEPPIIEVTAPESLPHRTSRPQETVEAIIRNVRNVNDVRCTLNGNEYRGFFFNPGTKAFTANLDLEPGRNDLLITAGNSAGTDQEAVVIIYKASAGSNPPATTSGENASAPCERPVVRISGASKPSTLPGNPRQARTTVRAGVRHLTARSQVRVYVNGERMTDFSFNPSTGEFSAEPILKVGRNTVRIVAKNDCGSDEDKVSVSYSDPGSPIISPPPPATTPNPAPQRNPPIVDITTPNNGISTNNPTVDLHGTVQHLSNRNGIRMTLNGRAYTNFNFSNGRISARNIPLDMGNNVIEVRGRNNYGADSDDVIVVRKSNGTPPPVSSPCDNPVVRITSFKISDLATGEATFSASAQHVASKAGLTLYLNNKRVTHFNFNARTKEVSATLKLKNGGNLVRLQAKNNCGNDEASRTVSYSPAPATPKPVVNITKPGNNATLNTNSVAVKATVLNVSGKGGVRVKLNGSNTNNFTYNGSSKTVTLTASLKKGNNRIVITATNASGSASDNVNVKYVDNTPPPCSAPSVTIRSFGEKGKGDTFKPRKGRGKSKGKESSSASHSAQLVAFAQHVSSKNEITVKHNGIKVDGFSFNASNGKIVANITLVEGSDNKVRVEVKNKCGSDVAKASSPLAAAKPVVRIKKPSDGQRFTVAKTQLKAVVRNVGGKSGITIRVNGKEYKNFKYFAKNGMVSMSNISLKKGKNTILVVGRNGSGTTKDQVLVYYDPPAMAKPIITIRGFSVPAPTPSNPNPTTTNFSAKITGVKGKSNIKMWFNGTPYNGFSYNAQTGMLTANLTFVQGQNKVKLTATNSGGSTSATDKKTF